MSEYISEGRKLAYYLGMTLIVLGFVLFLSVPLKLLSQDGRTIEHHEGLFKYGIIGCGLVAAGQLLRKVGARGLAGAGVVLDPEQAREDLEPYSRMAGGMVKDALEEADINLGSAQQTVRIKCRTCAALNDDDAKFCKACGQPL